MSSGTWLYPAPEDWDSSEHNHRQCILSTTGRRMYGGDWSTYDLTTVTQDKGRGQVVQYKQAWSARWMQLCFEHDLPFRPRRALLIPVKYRRSHRARSKVRRKLIGGTLFVTAATFVIAPWLPFVIAGVSVAGYGATRYALRRFSQPLPKASAIMAMGREEREALMARSLSGQAAAQARPTAPAAPVHHDPGMPSAGSQVQAAQWPDITPATPATVAMPSPAPAAPAPTPAPATGTAATAG